MNPARQRPSRWIAASRKVLPTLRFWMETEVHVYAFSVSANILLSFFPFLIVMTSLFRYLHWRAAIDAINFALNDYFPGPITEFLTRNLQVVIARRGNVQIVSILVLLFTANGVFEPLEVAFNRIWKCGGNRSFLKNQLVSFGLMFACGGLILLSTVLTAINNQYVLGVSSFDQALSRFLETLFYKLAAIPAMIMMLFLIYWLLPNCKVKPGDILPAAIVVGLSMEVLKYVNLLLWPFVREKFYSEYGPFSYAATLILWGFLASMLVLAGVESAARRATRSNPDQPIGIKPPAELPGK